jgi:peptidoglycan L-alanyl-D-glutamate endopeptidase CwlK
MTCHRDIQAIMNKAIKYYDFSVLCGTRTPAEQFELFKKGRKVIIGDGTDPNNYEISNKSEVVTFKDGFIKKSMHNYSPSKAVDIVPYPINWKDLNRFYYLAGLVQQVAAEMVEKKLITHKLVWGADWDDDRDFTDHIFMDYPHFQLERI